MKILSTHAHGLQPIGERTTDAAGNEVQRFKANLIRVGSFSHPTDGWNLEVTQSKLRHWLDAAKQMLANNISLPFTSEHWATNAGSTLGYVDSVSIDGDWLVAEGDFIGTDAILAASRNYVSVEIEDDAGDGLGNRYGDAIVAVTLTPRPIVTEQGRIAASVNGVRRTAEVYVMDARARNKSTADAWVDEMIAMSHGIPPATQKLIDRAAKDVDQLGARLTNHTVADFEIAADALGMETGTKLLDSLENEDELVSELAQRIRQLRDQMEAMTTNVIPAIEAKGTPAARQTGASDVHAMSIERWIDDRGDFHDLTQAQSKQLRGEMRQRAKAMSIATQDRANADDDWVDRAIRDQNAQVAGAA